MVEAIQSNLYLFADMSKRRAWCAEEKEACIHHFGKWLAIGSLPGKQDIDRVRSTVDCLEDRTWVQIKNYIRNLIKKQ